VSTPALRLERGTEATLADYPVDAAWTADGRVLVGGGEGELALVNAQSGAVNVIGRHEPGVLNVGILAGDVAAVSSGQDGSVRRWAPGDGSDGKGTILHRGMGWPQSLCFNHDATLFAFAQGRTVRVHDADGATVRVFEDIGRGASLLAWRGRMRELAAAGQTHAWLCELDGGRVTQIDLEGGPVTLAYSPEGRILIAGLQDGVVSFRYVATGKKSRMSGYDGKVTHTTWSANSRYLATAASGASTVVLWDFSGKGPEGSAPLQLGTHTDRIEALAYQPGGKLLATAGRDARLALWQPGPHYRAKAEAPLPQAMDVHLLKSAPVLLRWSPDGKRLAALESSGRISFYDVRTA
jgi:WD40 repeat protein